MAYKETVEQASKEGISFEEPTDKTASEPSSSDVASKPETSTQDNADQGGPVKTDTADSTANVQKVEKVPFHKDPEIQKYLKRQEETLAKRVTAEYQHKLELLQAKLDAISKPSNELPKDQVDAAMQLAEILDRVPGFKDKLGLTRIQELESQLKSLTSREAEKAFESELTEVLDTAAKYGMNKDEVEDELREFISSDPIFSKLDYSHGTVKAAFRNRYFDKLGELKERELAKQQLEQKEKLKKAGSETNGTATNVVETKPKSMKTHLANLIQRGGGVIDL